MVKPSVKKDYLYLLRCALWDVRPDLDHMVDWNDLLLMAQRQTTIGLVGSTSLQTQATEDLLPESRCRLLTHLEKIRTEAEKADQLLYALSAVFDQHNVSFFLLKGLGLADFYPVPMLRQCGDIDLLVAPSDFENAVSVLQSVATPEAVSNAFFSEKHYHIAIKGIQVELHHCCMNLHPTSTDLVYQDIEKKALELGSDDFMLHGTNIHRPEPTFNSFYVFLHFWEHFKERGTGLRQVCDWTLLLHARNDCINRERLKVMLDSLGLMKPWRVFGSLAVKYLGLPEEEMPFFAPRYDRKARRLLRLVLKEGNFGKARPLTQRHLQQQGQGRRVTTLIDIQVRAWRVFTILPCEGIQLWKRKMVGGLRR